MNADKLNSLLVMAVVGLVVISVFFISVIVKTDKVINELVVMHNNCVTKVNGEQEYLNPVGIDVTKVKGWEQLYNTT